MTAVVPERGEPRLVDRYRLRLRQAGPPVEPAQAPPHGPWSPPGAADELVTADAVHEASLDLAASIDHLGLPGLRARAALTRRLLEDDDVGFGMGATGRPRRWVLDPLPVVIPAADWAPVAAGLAQRAELLDLVLKDLYGSRTLLRRGILPPALVLSHPGFVRHADRIVVPGPHQLVLAAADLARDDAGGWTVIGDRTQAPAGAGFAMENRRIVARVMSGLHRDTPLARLRGFFHTVRDALMAVAPRAAETPRVVLLSPGPESNTAFDQSFLATLLGFPLVTGEDLTVREGRVWMTTTGRLEPVDVVLRRVDASSADPLEFRSQSRLGAPGLVEASRLGNVSVVNGFGSGVLESPGLLAFTSQLSRALLDQDPALPTAPTWWCGLEDHRSHVLAHLERMVVKPSARQAGPVSTFGWLLTSEQREQLAARICAEPWAWCGQEPQPMSTAPVLTTTGLEPRRLVVRGFAVAHGAGFHVMDGGLAGVAGRANSSMVTALSGAVAKDVWVLTRSHADTADGAFERSPDLGPVVVREHPVLSGDGSPGLSPRAAEDLFWMGRYAERAEGTARLLRVVDDLAADHAGRPGTPGWEALRIMLAAVTRVTASGEPGVPEPEPDSAAMVRDWLRSLVLDPHLPGSVGYATRRMADLAREVREQLSLDTWLVLARLERTLAHPLEEDAALQPVLGQTLECLLALAGLGAESLIRDATWTFLDLGRRLERAQQLVALLRATLAIPAGPAVDPLVRESATTAAESVITHRRREAIGPVGHNPAASAAALLLLDRGNPRALLYQLDRMAEGLRGLSDPAGTAGGARPDGGPGAAVVRDLVARLREVDVDRLCEGDRTALATLLAETADSLRQVGTAVEAAHFVHRPPQRAFFDADWSGGQPAGEGGT